MLTALVESCFDILKWLLLQWKQQQKSPKHENQFIFLG